MQSSLTTKLERLASRLEETTAELSDPLVTQDQERFRRLSREHAELTPVVERFTVWRRTEEQMAAAQSLLQDADPEVRAMASEEVAALARLRESCEADLKRLMLPRDPNDERNIFLEVRAGTGGDEAALFAGDLFRMYTRYAESKGFGVEILSESPGEHGGYKEIISRIVGRGAFSRLKFESGVHRVQRVPTTEAQGRIHTSTCTVAILPELDQIADVTLNPADLRIDTYRSSGAGGQHVNKTDSAVRITHLPTGIVVECQDERSQHKNRARAMSLLQARLLAAEQEKQQSAQARSRRLQVGTGDRSERIRTYNFPQGRLTDHRINLTLYKLPQVMSGELDELLDALAHEHQAELLAEIEA